MFKLTPVTGLQSGLVALMVCAAGIAVFGPQAASAPSSVQDEIAAPPRKSVMEQFMAKKLAAAQHALEGVAREDYQQIGKMTAEMIELSRHEAWEQMASHRFVQDTADFVTAAEFLQRMALAEDAEGTSLGFMRLTLTCANCHAHVRSSSVAQRVPQHKGSDVSLIAAMPASN